MTSEKVFIIGATGNIGTKVVHRLLAKNVAVTVFARDPSKASSLFSGSVNVVQGDYEDLTPLKTGLVGHTRLFLLIRDLTDHARLKGDIAKYAFDAGVKQIVDLSSSSFGSSWRENHIGHLHVLAEEAMLNIPHRGHVVTLRPTRFMSNVFYYDKPSDGVLKDIYRPDDAQAWISPNDIADVAVTVLTEDIDKHGDSLYELTSDVVTLSQRAALYSKILGGSFTYKQISGLEKFNRLQQTPALMPYRALYELCSMRDVSPQVSAGISILLGRDPETFEHFLTENKEHLL